MKKRNNDIDLFVIGNTILDTQILDNYINRNFDHSLLQNRYKWENHYIPCVMKLFESIVLHENIVYFGNLPEIWKISKEYLILQNIIIPITPQIVQTKSKISIQIGNLLISEKREDNVKPILSRSHSFSNLIGMLLSSHTGLSYTTTNNPELNLTNYEQYQKHAIKLTTKEVQKEIKRNNKWLYTNYFSLDNPLLFDYIIQRASSLDDALKHTIDLRNSIEAKKFRERSIAFEKALKDDDRNMIIEMIGEMDEAISQLSKRTSTSQNIPIDISFPIGIGIDLDEVISNMTKLFGKKRHLQFISRLYNSGIRSHGTIEKFYGFFNNL